MQRANVFRDDIEGLRAVSILAVLFYHAEVPGFASGYVGVDAFFVISGFLITGVLLREIETRNTIDLPRFWGRRSARLLPNAILTLLVTSVCIMTLSAVLTREAGVRDVAAALLYFANFRFSTRALDYFDQGIQSSPVLHFWSLSVEEQFYACWPIILMIGLWLFRRLNRGFCLFFLGSVVAISFGVMVYWTRIAPSRAFFDTESRVWQLAIGAFLAVWQVTRQDTDELTPAIGWAGLIGLLLSIVFVDEMPLNPRVASLFPVLATAAALYGGTRSRTFATNPVLGNVVMQWIGRRSYSIYLWHWPVLVFVAPVIGRGFAILLVFAISAAVFAWVEHPLRVAAPIRLSSRKLLGLAISSCCVGAGFVIVLPHFDPAYSSARGEILKRLAEAKNDGPRLIRPTCTTAPDAETGRCAFGRPGGPKKVALYGDSHAEQLFDGLDAAAVSAGWELRAWVRGGCTPIDFPDGDPACVHLRRDALAEMAAYKPDLIVVSSSNAGAVWLHEPQTGKRIERQRSLQIWKAGFKNTLLNLSSISRHVVVVRDTPINAREFGTECLATREPEDCATPRSQALAADAPDVIVTRSVPGIELLDLSDRFCDSKRCPGTKDGLVVYRADNNHITATMSLRLQPDFVKLLVTEQ